LLVSDEIKKKALAAGKVALGVGRIVGGVATATGHGLAGAYLGKHHMMGAAAKLARSGIEGGMEMIDEGISDWSDD
jgi:hypothetical protein